MNPLRQAYVKIKQAVIDSGMTYDQIKAQDWQFVPSEVLTPTDLAQVKRYNNLVMRWLKADWIATREDDFIQNRYLPALRSVKDRNLSMYTVREVYDYTIAYGVPIEIADKIADKAFTIFANEVLNG